MGQIDSRPALLAGAPSFILLALLLVALPAAAAPGDVAGTIPLRVSHPTGVAFDGSRLWVADRSTDRFYGIDPANGAVLDSLVAPGYFPSGLAWDGKLLWSTDPADGRIYATDPSNGFTVRSIESPTPSPTGIAWDGAYLWICDNRTDVIARIDPGDGTTIRSFRAPASDSRSLAFDGERLWCSDRIRDRIYLVDPASGLVLVTLDAPGPYTWGLAWMDGELVCADYEDDLLYRLVVRDDRQYAISSPRRAVVDFTTEADVLGPGTIVSLEVCYAVPRDRENQTLLSPPRFVPEPDRFETDRWGQRVAVFRFENLTAASSVEVAMQAEIETSAIRWFVFPGDVGEEMPREIREAYLADDAKFDLGHPFIRSLVDSIVGGETNPYWKARRLYQYLIANMEYELAGGWNTAPTVLRRKTGSCSEYSFSFIALCRAAGVPARYVGSLVVRGDDASYDDVFHRWNEIYLPNYGWVPVDANAGDREWPADQAAAFGGVSNRFLVTTEGGGDSEYLGWSYNHENRWVSSGKCRLRLESTAEWEPLE
ncbi:MAG: transglutaminase [Candidatus Krumholzibacteriota bacterium]|nr:transglutaminase [Candidatus Krumholzibacteriota bacterium]